jgi:hypothetical protein
MRKLSQEALQRKAMALGGRVEVAGHSFNASRNVLALAPPKPPAPTPAPTPPPTPTAPPAPAPDPIEGYTKAALGVSRDIKDVLVHLQQQLKQETTRPVRQWIFKVVRDAKGDMDTIIATAKE